MFEALFEIMFEHQEARTLFKASKELYEQTGYVGVVPLIEKLGDAVKPLILYCSDIAPPPARLKDYINIVRENWRMRDLYARLSEIIFTLTPGITVKEPMEQLEAILEFQRKIDSSLTEESTKPFIDSLAEWLMTLNMPSSSIRRVLASLIV